MQFSKPFDFLFTRAYRSVETEKFKGSASLFSVMFLSSPEIEMKVFKQILKFFNSIPVVSKYRSRMLDIESTWTPSQCRYWRWCIITMGQLYSSNRNFCDRKNINSRKASTVTTIYYLLYSLDG